MMSADSFRMKGILSHGGWGEKIMLSIAVENTAVRGKHVISQSSWKWNVSRVNARMSLNM